MKISPNLYGRMDGSKFLMFSLVSRKFLTMRNIALYSVCQFCKWYIYHKCRVEPGKNSSISNICIAFGNVTE